MNKINIALFFGGTSLERKVSIITGKQTYKALDSKKYNVFPIFIDSLGTWRHIKNFSKTNDVEQYKKCKVLILMGENYFYFNNLLQNKIKIHCAINCLHGGFGENGALCDMLYQCKIPITSSNSTSGVCTLNKHLTKLVLKDNNLNVLPYILVNRNNYLSKIEDFIKKQPFPFVVKPIDMGSSIGVSMAQDYEHLINSLLNALKLTKQVIVEVGINKVTEYNCACYNNRNNLVVSDVEKPIKKSSILTYAEKYGSKGGKMPTKVGTKNGFSALGREFPAKISDSLKQQIQELTKQAYALFNCSGIVRCDFIYYKRKLYLNEINSVPGSLAYYLFKPNTTFNEILDNLITTAIITFNTKKEPN